MTTFYHVWFKAKAGTVLEGPAAEDARELLLGAAKGAEVAVVEVEVTFDHVHMLLAVSGGQDLSPTVRQLKAANSLWQEGYGWRTIAPSELPTVRRYITMLRPLLYR